MIPAEPARDRIGLNRFSAGGALSLCHHSLTGLRALVRHEAVALDRELFARFGLDGGEQDFPLTQTSRILAILRRALVEVCDDRADLDRQAAIHRPTRLRSAPHGEPTSNNGARLTGDSELREALAGRRIRLQGIDGDRASGSPPSFLQLRLPRLLRPYRGSRRPASHPPHRSPRLPGSRNRQSFPTPCRRTAKRPTLSTPCRKSPRPHRPPARWTHRHRKPRESPPPLPMFAWLNRTAR